MSVDYAGIALEVAAAYTEVAQGTITLTRTTSGESNPETPWIPGEPTTVSYTLNGIAEAVTVDQANAKYIDGTVITTADLVISCAVFGVMPDMSDALTIDGVARTLKKIVHEPAAGVPVMHKLFVQG